MNMQDTWKLGERTLHSRIIVGTGKYKSNAETTAALEASGAEIVTVALRRVDLASKEPTVLDAIDRKKYILLPNTAGCYTADEAVRTCHLAEELWNTKWVKLEVLGDQKTLFPDIEETLKAARILVKEGFIVLPYTSDDPITAKKLQDIGCVAVMPLAAPIGSGLGIRNPHNIRLVMESVTVPVIVPPDSSSMSMSVVFGAVKTTGVPLVTMQLPNGHGRLLSSSPIKLDEFGGSALTKYDPLATTGNR
jgi:thiazole synthase